MDKSTKDNLSKQMKKEIEAIVENTWAEGLHPTYAKMDDTGSKLFIMATMSEMEDPNKAIPLPQDDATFLSQIIRRRIEAMHLPIKFSDAALLGLNSLVRSPGAAVALLIDCLNAFEGQTVTMSKLAAIYPWGFYDEDTMERYIDNYLKPRKVKWAEIY